MRPSDRAWLTLGGGVLVWDLLCPENEMLSEASKRYSDAHPLLAYAVIAAVALHLGGRLPGQLDPIRAIGVGVRKVKR